MMADETSETRSKTQQWRELQHCPLCASENLVPRVRPSRWIGRETFEPVAERLGVRECADCEFVFTNPRPSPELLAQFYDSEDYECHEHLQPNNSQDTRFQAILDVLADCGLRGGRLLDFGCGGGFFVRYAQAHGFEAWGHDVGRRAKQSCETLGLNFLERLEQAPGRFDAIVLSHVLEHMPDFRDFFQQLDQVTDERTLVLVQVPNVRSARARLAHPVLSRYLSFDERYRAFPIHLSYFSYDTLRQLFSKQGYEFVHSANFGVGLDECLVERTDEKTVSRGQGPQRASTRAENGARSRLPLPKPMQRLSQSAKHAIKHTIWKHWLGENVCLVTRKCEAKQLQHSRAKPAARVA